MKTSRNLSSAVRSLSLIGSLVLCASAAKAGTAAYWRFEAGPADAQVTHLSGIGGVWSADIADTSGNGNDLSVWDESGAGFAYKTDVAWPTVPRTGAANNFSVKNTGGGPAMWTESAAMKTLSPAAFTIEASFKPENGGWRTIVGRDSRGAATVNGDLAALYFQITPGNAVAIKYADVSGAWHEAVSADGLITGFDWGSDPNGTTGHWYNMAGVSDGTMLSLYLNSGSGYVQVAQTDMTGSSANTAMTAGMGDGGDWDAGNWTVGRGLYAGGHGDRGYGFIDEVRISDSALSPNQFLAVPEPSSLALAGLGAMALLLRRRVKA